ncbi:hypothetical protein DLP3_080 [Stenotrophomonas phage vB_SmaS_DLP_3]|nr:hypothetical protein DLP3_080 [Stenotrophomonas phage vB_SmaS_DLP_3]
MKDQLKHAKNLDLLRAGYHVDATPRMEALNAAIDALTVQPQKVYAFVHSSCKWEESPYVVSLHATKAGAWKAMRAHRYAEAVMCREVYLRHGGTYSPLYAGVAMIWAVRTYEVKP